MENDIRTLTAIQAFTETYDEWSDVYIALAVSRKLQADRQKYGYDRILEYVEDVESDWLEQW